MYQQCFCSIINQSTKKHPRTVKVDNDPWPCDPLELDSEALSFLGMLSIGGVHNFERGAQSLKWNHFGKWHCFQWLRRPGGGNTKLKSFFMEWHEGMRCFQDAIVPWWSEVMHSHKLHTVRWGASQVWISSRVIYRTIYAKPLTEIAKNYINIHLYADDTQLYTAFKPEESEEAMERLEQCTEDIRKWMASRYLKLNDSFCLLYNVIVACGDP